MSLNLKSLNTFNIKSIDSPKEVHPASGFDTLPNSAYIREAKLVQCPDDPNCTGILPFSSPTLWRKVKSGTFPKPVKLSERVTAWKVQDVRAWLEEQEAAK